MVAAFRGSQLRTGLRETPRGRAEAVIHLDALSAERVREGQRRGMKELPLEGRRRDAVGRVADDRQVDGSEMHANLVHPPRLEPHRSRA